MNWQQIATAGIAGFLAGITGGAFTTAALLENGIAESVVVATEHAVGTADTRRRGHGERGLQRFENELQREQDLAIARTRFEASHEQPRERADQGLESVYIRKVMERAGAYLALVHANAAVEEAEHALAQSARHQN